MNTHLNIWCANVGWKWHDNWVHRLYKMVSENCSIPLKFRCISDHEIDGIETTPLSRELLMSTRKPQGCWAKVDAWRAPIGSYNLLLDLDICIMGDIAKLVSDTPHAALDPRTTEERVKLNGSCIAWRSTKQTQAVYPSTIPYIEFPRGEQEYVQKALGGFVPLEGVYSYKGHLINKDPPEDTVIVYFHGYPTPATDSLQKLEWVSRTWEEIERIERN